MTTRWNTSLLSLLALPLLTACGGSSNVVQPSMGEPFLLNPQVRVDRGPSGASDVELCCDGTTVYAVWEDDRNDPGDDRDIYFNFSSDSGRTWLETDVRLDSGDLPGLADSKDQVICCSGDRVYVAWEDLRNGEQDIYFNYSEDRGQTWQATDERLDTGDIAGDSKAGGVEICCDGLNVYVAWKDQRAGGSEDNEDIYFNRSLDGGATWLPQDVRVCKDTAGAARSDSIQVCCSGSSVYLSWKDQRNDPGAGGNDDIYFNRSVDAGTTWLAQDVRLDATNRPGIADADEPHMCCNGNVICVVWHDDRNGEYDVFLSLSPDGGDNWRLAVRIDEGPAGSNRSALPQVCCDGTTLHVLWEERSGGNDERLVYRRSSDLGMLWQAQQTIDQGGGDVDTPQLCCGDGVVFVAWADDRRDLVGGKDDIWLNYSLDYGVTWLFQDVRVDTDLDDAVDPSEPKLCCGPGVAYVAWYSPSPGDILLNRVMPDGEK